MWLETSHLRDRLVQCVARLSPSTTFTNVWCQRVREDQIKVNSTSQQIRLVATALKCIKCQCNRPSIFGAVRDTKIHNQINEKKSLFANACACVYCILNIKS